jgi:hypothetical protein
MKIGEPPLPLFDRLCRVSEDHFPALLPILRKAKLFRFPGKPHEILTQEHDITKVKAQLEHFFLPFDTTAVEDDATCTILLDTVGGQEGFTAPRHFVDCHMMFSDNDAFNDTPEMRAELVKYQREARERGVPADTLIVTMGTLEECRPDETDPTRVWIAGSGSMAFAVSKRCGMVIPPNKVAMSTELTASALRHARCAVEEVLYFNQPARFVVERTPVKGGRAPKHRTLERSYARPVYTLLTPKEICETMKITEPGHGTSKGGHWRRRHQRYLQSDYYKNKQGQTLLIEAQWVGPETAEVDGHFYRVKLDL